MCRGDVIRLFHFKEQHASGNHRSHGPGAEACVEKPQASGTNPANDSGEIKSRWSGMSEDVHTAANEREVALTHQEAIEFFQEMHHYHNKHRMRP